jgi:LmbE family N-acetylglucosaminyl deacetylase
LASTRTLLVVHAHPDDESVGTGGILARYSAEGVRTIVVTCTTGDLGEVSNAALLGDGGVGALRLQELEAAARVLGVARVMSLGYRDSGMAGWPHNHYPGALFAAPIAEAAGRLRRVLDEERPDVVVTHDETGGYGHPDHVRTHEVVRVALAAIASPRLYYERFPIAWSRAFVAALRAEGIEAPASAPSGADAGPDVHDIGVPDDVVTTTVDVSAYVKQKRAALACHRSQMPPSHFLMRMSEQLAARFWSHEFFSRATPGDAFETDLFAGLS